jgi:hypothetical protein
VFSTIVASAAEERNNLAPGRCRALNNHHHHIV